MGDAFGLPSNIGRMQRLICPNCCFGNGNSGAIRWSDSELVLQGADRLILVRLFRRVERSICQVVFMRVADSSSWGGRGPFCCLFRGTYFLKLGLKSVLGLEGIAYVIECLPYAVKCQYVHLSCSIALLDCLRWCLNLLSVAAMASGF